MDAELRLGATVIDLSVEAVAPATLSAEAMDVHLRLDALRRANLPTELLVEAT